MAKRLESLDILRGLDIFLLTAFGPLLMAFSKTGDYSWLQPVLYECDHCAWEGFRLWDLIMPLFMFMSGVTIPFSFAKYKAHGQSAAGNANAGAAPGAVSGGETVKWKAYLRILRRVVVLWILGMIMQGNLLDFDIHTLKLFTNTLQSIAVGYLFASILYLNVNPKWQISIAAVLLIAYWAAMMFIKVDGYGGGDFTRDGNLCEYIDRVVLGRWRDFATVDAAGNVVFVPWYKYTWILSSLTFIVTTMTGVFAGLIIRSEKTPVRKTVILLSAGAAMTAAGWIWNLQMPVIKHIWTSSMVLVASGYSFLLLGFFYYIVDVRGWVKGLRWLEPYGTNCIVAYMAGMIDTTSIFKSLLFGLEKYIGPAWYNFLITFCCVALVFVILRLLHTHKFFVRV